MPSTNMKNPMLDLYHNVVPLLKNCGDGSSASTNCFCTDPSVSYSQPCVIASTGSSSPIDSTSRAQCTYSTPTVSQPTVKPSTGGSLGSKPNVQFEVKPGSGSASAQPFTKAGNPQTLTSGGQPTYPNSLLFCQNFKSAGGDVTSSKPALAYSPSQGQFTASSWTSSEANKTTNLGFE